MPDVLAPNAENTLPAESLADPNAWSTATLLIVADMTFCGGAVGRLESVTSPILPVMVVVGVKTTNTIINDPHLVKEYDTLQ